MARLPQIVLPGIPHHVTQRGHGRQMTRALIAGRSDGIVDVAPALERIGDFAHFSRQDFDDALTYAALRKAETVGRPVGSPEWLADMEERTGLTLAPQKCGPKPE